MNSVKSTLNLKSLVSIAVVGNLQTYARLLTVIFYFSGWIPDEPLFPRFSFQLSPLSSSFRAIAKSAQVEVHVTSISRSFLRLLAVSGQRKGLNCEETARNLGLLGIFMQNLHSHVIDGLSTCACTEEFSFECFCGTVHLEWNLQTQCVVLDTRTIDAKWRYACRKKERKLKGILY